MRLYRIHVLRHLLAGFFQGHAGESGFRIPDARAPLRRTHRQMQRVTGGPAPSNGEGAGAKRPPTELSMRVYSALILISIALFLTLTSVESFAILITLFISAMAWEWGRLVRDKGLDAAFGVQITATAVA